MLKIRPVHIRAFEEKASSDFLGRTVTHLRTHFARNFELWEDEHVRAYAASGIERAEKARLVSERDVTLYINLMVLLGCDFICDPQLPWIAESLSESEPGDISLRLSWAYDRAMTHLDQIAGPRNAHWGKALQLLQRSSSITLLSPTGSDWTQGILKLLERAYPEKYNAVGESDLYRLVELGVKRCRTKGFSELSSFTLYVGLMFFLGSGFEWDPLLPWAGSGLNSQNRGNEKERVADLYRTARKHLDQWLS
jgi:hypothetical protein